jgi:putative transposase
MPDRPRRLPGFDYIGPRQYFLTFCTHGRASHFRAAATVALTHAQFVRAAADHEVEITAYCFMPDHVHLFVTGRTATADVRRFAAVAKQRAAFAFSRAIGGTLWQEGYFDRVVRSAEEAAEKLRYMLANPVRAGLVDRIDEYPHVGSEIWSVAQIAEFVQDGLARRRRP